MKRLALTYDDGPTRNTPALLDVLDKYKVPATFFMLGKQVERFPEAAKQISQAGHGIGNHSFNHLDLRLENGQQVYEEIRACGHALASLGILNQYFRPPYGSYNEETKTVVRNYGLEWVVWDIDTFDWTKCSTDQIMERMESQVGNGGIVLMHDGYWTKTSAEATERIIVKYRNEGFRFVSLLEAALPGIPRRVSL